MINDEGAKMKAQSVFEKIAWSAITAVALYAATQFKETSAAVSQLNINVAVALTRMTYIESRVSELERAESARRNQEK
jgi:hypothetical protein